MGNMAIGRSEVRRAALTKVALDNVASEVGGTLGAPLIGITGGAGIGALIAAIAAAAKGKRAIGARALAGAGAGALAGYTGAHLANLAGALTGMSVRRRTREEQQAHDRKSHLVNFIPGVGSYNYTKRMGRVLAGVGEPDGKPKKDESEKTAEAIQKRAQFLPSALGTAGLAVGGAMGGSAVTGDDQSWLKRIGKGTVAAGLMYGGYKALTDPRWQKAIQNGGRTVVNATRPGVEKAIAAIRGMFGKQAEATLAYPGDAYVTGFCKAAESVGVDPITLYKCAATPVQAWGLLGKGINAISRFSQAKLPQGTMAHGLQRGVNWFANTRPGKALSRYGRLINGGNVAEYQAQMGRFGRQMGRAQAAGNMPRWGRAMADYNHAAGLMANEQNAVNLARNATLLGGGTTLGLGAGYGIGKLTGGNSNGGDPYDGLTSGFGEWNYT